MGNYSGAMEKISMTISRKNPKAKLIELIDEADSDYMDISDQIVDKVVKKHTKVEAMIKEIMNMNLPSDVDESLEEHDEMSCFIFNNSTYCSNVKYDITKVGKDKVKLVVVYSL
jgi:hypothetical protein